MCHNYKQYSLSNHYFCDSNEFKISGLPKPAIINQSKAIGMSKFLYLGDLQPEDIVYTVTPLYHSAACLALFTIIDCGKTNTIINWYE